MKLLEEFKSEGTFLKILKSINDKCTVNITFKWRKTRTNTIKIKNKRLLSILLFNIVLKVLARAENKRIFNKRIQIGKEAVKLSLGDDVIL